MNLSDVLKDIPQGLRAPLLDEYRDIRRNFAERRWGPSQLSAGRFCEIVYCIVDGYGSGAYLSAPTKPKDFVGACRSLETRSGVPRSIQIGIPRILPALYEARNNRDSGHVGGEVSSNHMDSVFVLSSSSWVLAELVRVYHKIETKDAQAIVERLVQQPSDLIWQGARTKRVLVPSASLREHVLILLGTSAEPVNFSELCEWTEYKNKAYLRKLLINMHDSRMIEYDRSTNFVEILPPGTKETQKILRKYAESD